jgi:flagellar hook assembly protein FlgD
VRDDQGESYSGKNWVYNKAGEVCKYLSTMTIPNTGNFDPNIVRRIYWDGTDNNGRYVKNGNYEIRLTAKNYPDEGLYQPTIKQITQNIDLLKVFDLPDAEAYAINVRGKDMNLSYQLSVPMKVGIQILKPGTTIYDYSKGTLRDPSTGQEVQDINDVLVKSIVGIRPSTTLIEELWDGTDYSGHEVPDGTYPFRFVTALNSADIDSLTGEIVGAYAETDGSTDSTAWKINKVADTYQYVNLHHATVAIGDGQFVCEDWERTVFFYPNPFKTATGTMEITKLPVPGTMSIKLYNLAGDLVREGGYTCVDAQNMVVNMGNNLYVQPDNNVSNIPYPVDPVTGSSRSLRNAALRCFWDRTNDHGKRVARGVYFGLVDFRAKSGKQHCQKVVKILIPK